jgi:hypothetical protein
MAGLSISRLINIVKRIAAVSNKKIKRDLLMINQRNSQDEEMDEYAKLFTKDMEELKEIAEQKKIPNPDEFNKEELVMAIEFADLAEE